MGSVTNCLNPLTCKNCSMSVECDDDSKLLLKSPSRSVGTDSKGIFSRYELRWATKDIVRSCGRLLTATIYHKPHEKYTLLWLQVVKNGQIEVLEG